MLRSLKARPGTTGLNLNELSKVTKPDTAAVQDSRDLRSGLSQLSPFSSYIPSNMDPLACASLERPSSLDQANAIMVNNVS